MTYLYSFLQNTLEQRGDIIERIIVIGCPGSGKSTLSRQLSDKLGLPLVHLDMLCWREGWKKIPKDEFDKLLMDELIKPRWIIDGNFNRTIPLRLQYCDTVIWLDYPRITCMLGVLKRVIKYHGKTRPDMGENCPEKFDFEFLRYIWRFNKMYRKRYREMLDKTDGVQVIVLKNRKEAERFLEEI